jgi:catechol 2,3-dioxygenase-like lactoylglutathione lyase family enzyme
VAEYESPSTGLVPELDVSDLTESLAFYVGLAGFVVVYERPAEDFVYLDLEGSSLMLQAAVGPGRRFRTAPLDRPFGRGVNFQISVADVTSLHDRMAAAGVVPIVPMEDRWYPVEVVAEVGRWSPRGPTLVGNRQFVVADPDGYLWRFFSSLGTRPG